MAPYTLTNRGWTRPPNSNTLGPSSPQRATPSWMPNSLEFFTEVDANPPQGQVLQNGHSLGGAVQRRMQASNDKTQAGAPRHGNEDVAMVACNLMARSLKNNDVRKTIGVVPIAWRCMKDDCGGSVHIMHSHENLIAKTALRFHPGGHRPCGRPKKRWMDRIREDKKVANVATDGTLDRNKWRTFILYIQQYSVHTVLTALTVHTEGVLLINRAECEKGWNSGRNKQTDGCINGWVAEWVNGWVNK